jgi:hypothetical protein
MRSFFGVRPVEVTRGHTVQQCARAMHGAVLLCWSQHAEAEAGGCGSLHKSLAATTGHRPLIRISPALALRCHLSFFHLAVCCVCSNLNLKGIMGFCVSAQHPLLLQLQHAAINTPPTCASLPRCSSLCSRGYAAASHHGSSRLQATGQCFI